MTRLTPMDIFNKDFRTVMRGYDIKEVDQFLDLVLQNYEEVLEENERLKEEIRMLRRSGNNQKINGDSDSAAYDDVIKDILARLDRLEKLTYG